MIIHEDNVIKTTFIRLTEMLVSERLSVRRLPWTSSTAQVSELVMIMITMIMMMLQILRLKTTAELSSFRRRTLTRK